MKTGTGNILQLLMQLSLSNSLYTVLFANAYFSLWLGICVQVDDVD